MSKEPRRYGWLVGGAAACLASARRCEPVPYARNSELERIFGRAETSEVRRAGEYGKVVRNGLSGRRRAPGSRRPGLRCGLAAEAHDVCC